MKAKILVALPTMASLLATSATAQVNYAVSGGTAYVTTSPFASGNVVIASTYQFRPVTSIGDSAFSYCTSLTSVTIPNSVLHIGNQAFYDCTSLTDVTIGNSVTNIGDFSFYDCTSLMSVTIPNSVTSIGNYAFYLCTSLTSVTIPNSVTNIGAWAFRSCVSLRSVTISDSVTGIGDSAFYYCTSLTNVTIRSSVINIGALAFGFCYRLTSMTIPNSVTSIGAEAFYSCSSLTSFSVDGANSVYSSLDGVLFNKAQTTLIQFPGGRGGSYAIPNSVTSIGDSAFSYCNVLTSVTIPNSVASLGGYTFSYCTSLTSVTIPSSITSIGDFSFYDCTSLMSVTIPNSVTNIGNDAFGGCASLANVTIPNSVTSIGDYAFGGCTSLTNFSVDGANSVYGSLDGVLFNKAQTTLIQFPGGRGGSYTIPNSVTNIGSAFEGCAITSVTIPNSVTNIGAGAFYSCTSLTNLTFLGNAPSADVGVFSNLAADAKVYYYYGNTGWGPIYGGLPTVMLGAPAPQFGAGSAGVKPGGFGFTLNGVTNQTIVVEASTNLANWQPIWTSTLSTLSTNFVDPDWVNYPHRFYRLRSN